MSNFAIGHFVDLIEERYAMFFDNRRLHILQEGINERVLRLKCDSESSYFQLINKTSLSAVSELSELIKLITIGETYFYRNPSHFQVLQVRIFQELLVKNEPVHILSAACSTGEEAYTLAMLADLYYPQLKVRIVAFDVNPISIEHAKRGVYGKRSVSYLPQCFKENYFDVSGEQWAIKEKIKHKVSFYLGNLAEPNFSLPPRQYQVIMCRNVMIYFTIERIKQIVSNIAKSLHPNGYLFLGDAETLRGISDEYEVVEHNKTFFYCHANRGASDSAVSILDTINNSLNNEEPGINDTADVLSGSEDFIVTAVATDAHENVSASDKEPTAFSGRATEDTALSVEEVYQLSLQHVLNKNLEAARGQLSSLLDKEPASVDALLLLAIVEANAGKSIKAMEHCGTALSLRDTDSKVHYIQAILLEGSGKEKEAKRALESCIFLDNKNALAYFKLANMCESASKTTEAKRYYRNVLQCIGRFQESNPEFEVFSGGFSPSMIKGICEAALSGAQ